MAPACRTSDRAGHAAVEEVFEPAVTDPCTGAPPRGDGSLRAATFGRPPMAAKRAVDDDSLSTACG